MLAGSHGETPARSFSRCVRSSMSSVEWGGRRRVVPHWPERGAPRARRGGLKFDAGLACLRVLGQEAPMAPMAPMAAMAGNSAQARRDAYLEGEGEGGGG